MADTLESLEIEVKHNSSGAADGIYEVTESIRQMGKQLASVLPQLKQYADLLASVRGKARKSVPAVAVSKANASGDATVETRAGGKTKEAISDAGNASKESAKGIRELALEAKKAATGGLSRFISSLKRIAFYRILRGILKTISQAMSEGLQNAYAFSDGITTQGHRFAEALDSMKSSSTQLKNQLGSAFIGLLAAVEPILIRLIDLVTRVVDIIAQFFAAFTGNSYLKAVSVTDKFADTMKSGAGAAKDWKNQLMGFDEINRLNEPSKGGGGSALGLDPADMFEDTAIDPKIQNFVKTIKRAIGKIDWDKMMPFLKLAGGIFLASNLPGAKTILTLLTKLAAAHPIIAAIVAAVATMAVYGDKISALVENLREKVLRVFDNIKTTGLKSIDSIIAVLRDIIDFVLGAFATVSSLVYKLFHGDFRGALQDLMKLISEVVAFAVNVSIDAVNVVLGLLSDLANAILSVLALVWNAIADGINAAAKFIYNNLVVPVQNAFVNLAIGLKKAWNDFVDFLNGKISGAIASLNDFIRWANKNFGANLSEIPVNVIPKIPQEEIDRLESTKLKPIDETVNIVPKIEKLPDIDLRIKGHLDASSIASTLNSLFGTLANNVGTLTRSVVTGQTIKSTHMIQFSAFANGGYPESGELFVAREDGAGAEMVGTVGGRTAVASNDDILEGIRLGVYDAVMAAMSNNQNNATQNIRVYLDSREIKAGQQRLSMAQGV